MVHKDKQLFIRFEKYLNGQHCIKLYEKGTELLWAVASLAVGFSLQADEIAIKNYSENENILDTLLEAEVIHYPHRYISQGFVRIPICKIQEHYYKKYCTESKTYPFQSAQKLTYTGYFTEN